MPAKVRGVLNFFIDWLRGKQMNSRASHVLAAALPLFAAFILATAAYQPRESYAVSTNTVSSYNSFNSYYFPWYDSVWGKTWALMANSQANPDSTSYLLDLGTIDAFNNPVIEPLTTDYLHTASGWPTVHNIYMGKMGGPLRVNASNNLPLVSERSLFGNSFEEVWAVPYDELDSHYWWPVYDSSTPGMKNWILAANPWENQEDITVRIRINRPDSDLTETHTLAPGETWTPIYTGVFGKPVEMTAWSASGSEFNPADARKVIASQRVLWNGAFNEMMGIPASRLSSLYLWTWYDDDSPGADNWIVVGNPSATEQVFVSAIVFDPNDPEQPLILNEQLTLMPEEVAAIRKPGMGGPVAVVSCADLNNCSNTGRDIFTSQRVLFGPSFGELAGTRLEDLDFGTKSWTWYDQQSPGSTNWILLTNVDNQHIYAEIRVAGNLQWMGGVGVLSNVTPTLNGIIGGPVEARAWLWETNEYGQQLKQTPASILASQRVLWNGYFNEIVGK